MLAIRNLSVSIDEKPILADIDLSVQPGEVHALMGPNGSGKSTLAYAVAGHPRYQNANKEKESIVLDGEDISQATPDQRANKGLYLASQYPMAVPGLTTLNFLWQLYKKRIDMSESKNGKKISLLEFRKWIEGQAQALGLKPELLKRGLNDGFSGGEKKKMEILQMLVFGPKYIILDEIDSGLDVDALKKIAKTVARITKENKVGVIVITHYSRILKYLPVSHVHILKSGKIVEEGDGSLVEKIENYGFDNK